METATKRILGFMLNGFKITPTIALEKFGCKNLTEAITELQTKYDMRVNRDFVTETNNDNRSTYMAYWLTSSQIERINKSKKQ
jgi:hypothetical protein